MKHLIFFDDTCDLCKNTIRHIAEKDTRNQFEYHPLTSTLAKQKLSSELLKGDTVVLLENGERLWVRGKAFFRICKLLGGKYRFLAPLAYLPGVDLVYRLIAKLRHSF